MILNQLTDINKDVSYKAGGAAGWGGCSDLPLPPHRVKALKCGFGGLWEMLSIPKVPHGESMPSRVGWDFRTPPHHHHHKEMGCPWEGSVQTPTHRSEEGGGLAAPQGQPCRHLAAAWLENQ